jgi:hypothetical protein
MALFVGPLLAIVAGRLLKSPSGPSDEERYGRPEDVPDAPPGYSPFGWADWGGMVVDAAAIGLMLLAAGMLKGGWAGSRVEATIWVLAGLVLAGGLRLALFEGPSPV